MAPAPARAMASRRGRKGEGHKVRLVTQISLDIEVVIEDGLEPLGLHIPVHLVKAAAVIDLELLIPLGSVPLLPGIFTLVVPDAGGDAGGHLGGGDPDDAVAEAIALPGGDGDPGEGEEDTVGAQHLAQLALPHVQRGDLVVVDDGAQAGAGQGHLGVGIFALEIVEVQGAGQGVLPEVGQPQQGRKATPRIPPRRARSWASKR